MTTLQTSKLYKTILTTLTKIYDTTRTSMLEAYWKTGQYIIDVEQEYNSKAEYGERLIERLSQDLTTKYGRGFSITNLKNMRRFYRIYPEETPESQLEWSKYVMLLSIKDEKERKRLEQKAMQENLTRWQLKKQVDLYHLRNRSGDETDYRDLLPDRRGILYLYKEVEEKGFDFDKKETLLDCGFNIWRYETIENREKAKKNELFKLEKRKDSYYISETYKPDKKNTGIMYTYKAYVEKVIDGDTIWADIDCGFNTYSRQKIRFKGIDAPDISFSEGIKARNYVQRSLKNSEFIVIKTYKTDMYDRYVSDIFYLPGERDAHIVAEKGMFLNQLLLDEGLARII